MRNIVLDIQPMEEKSALHQYVKEQFEFSFGYGANLDSLYDELTSLEEPCTLTLRYSAKPKGAMVAYLPRLLATFKDAARENYNLVLHLEEAE